jgi:hypothetical protein
LSKRFQKYPYYQIVPQIRPVGTALMYPDIRTGMTKLLWALRDTGTRPKNTAETDGSDAKLQIYNCHDI